jgi:alpha-ketoglutarate-dependent taurine dioxygenase
VATWEPLPAAPDADAHFGAEVSGLDLGSCSAGRDGLVRPADAEWLREVLEHRHVVAVRGLVLDGAPAFERLCRVFGDVRCSAYTFLHAKLSIRESLQTALQTVW